ncbi:unnamed protein product [Rhodiola kirilowii]
MDFITQLPKSHGLSAIMVVTDRLTKYAHFIGLPGGFTAESVARSFVKEICRLHGLPTKIVSDRDPVFMSRFWRDLFKLQDTTLATSSAYHPQTDGQTEVVNRCLEDYLRCFVAENQTTWAEFLPWAELHYNTSWHSSIRLTPFEAVYGRPPPKIVNYIPGASKVTEVDDLLTKRTTLMAQLRINLLKAR